MDANEEVELNLIFQERNVPMRFPSEEYSMEWNDHMGMWELRRMKSGRLYGAFPELLGWYMTGSKQREGTPLPEFRTTSDTVGTTGAHAVGGRPEEVDRRNIVTTIRCTTNEEVGCMRASKLFSTLSDELERIAREKHPRNVSLLAPLEGDSLVFVDRRPIPASGDLRAGDLALVPLMKYRWSQAAAEWCRNFNADQEE